MASIYSFQRLTSFDVKYLINLQRSWQTTIWFIFFIENLPIAITIIIFGVYIFNRRAASARAMLSLGTVGLIFKVCLRRMNEYDLLYKIRKTKEKL